MRGFVRKEALFVLVALAAAVALLLLLRSVGAPVVRWREAQQTTLKLLRDESLMFLVTDRLVTQVIVELDESNLLLGRRQGFLIGTARLYYGVDLQKLNDSCFQKDGGRLIVNVPEPQELDFSVDLNSLRFISKRSGLMVVADWLMGRDLDSELRGKFEASAMLFLKENKLLPDRARLLERLNRLAPLISSRVGIEVAFR